jgi:hypothetical protein
MPEYPIHPSGERKQLTIGGPIRGPVPEPGGRVGYLSPMAGSMNSLVTRSVGFSPALTGLC